MDGGEVVVLILTIVFSVVLLLACFVWSRNRCFKRQQYDTIDEVSNRLWVGKNPTEPTTQGEQVVINAPEEDEAARKNIRVSSNFCRSCAHDRQLDHPMPGVGYRKSKFFSQVSDAVVTATQGRKVPLVLTKHDVIEDGVCDIASSKGHLAFKTMLQALKHPYILDTLDVGLSADKQACFVMRPWSSEGSLRDLIYQVRDNSKPCIQKYPKLADVRKRRSARPVQLSVIARYGRQILEALTYLKELNYPYHHLHTGNIIIFNNSCKLSDYENSLFGYKHRLHKKIKKLPDPTIGAFGVVIFEMAAGFCVPLKGTVALRIETPGYEVVNDLLNWIFNPTPAVPVTLEGLLDHQFFQAQQVKIARTPQSDRADRVLLESDRISAMLNEVRDHFDITVFKTRTKQRDESEEGSDAEKSDKGSGSEKNSPAASDDDGDEKEKQREREERTKRKPRRDADSDDETGKGKEKEKKEKAKGGKEKGQAKARDEEEGGGIFDPPSASGSEDELFR